MTTAAVRGVVRGLGAGLADPPTDADLVNAFASRRDEAAFAELLRRHGPVVLGVCRRILSDPHAAEDAFQAVFLVLARKASAIRPPGLVGNWLYGVAVRTARKAKVAEVRRWRREMRYFLASRERERPEEPPDAELRAAIDAEFGQLPTSLRAVVVMCDLGGKSRSEAARELGCPEGTLTSRLEKARRILAARLTRRGLAVPAAGVSTLLAPAMASAVPPTLAANTLAAALGSATASPSALLLAEGVVRTMTANKLKLWAAPFLVLAAVAGGAVFVLGNPPARPAASQKPAAVPAKTPDGRWKEVKTLETSGWLAGSVAYSPDGKRLFVGGTGRVRAYNTATLQEVWTTKVDGDAQHFAAISLPLDGHAVAATFADGIRFLAPDTGKIVETLEQKGSKPTIVAWFPEDPPPPGVKERSNRWVVFDSGTEIAGLSNAYSFWNWNAGSKARGMGLIADSARMPRRPAGEVPLATDPKGRWAVISSMLNDSKKYLLNLHYTKPIGQAVGRSLVGHTATVTSAACSADGSVIVSGDTEGVVIVWDTATFAEKSRVQLPVKRVQAVAVTADGATIAAAGLGTAKAMGPPARDVSTEEVFVWRTAAPSNDLKPISPPREAGEKFEGVAGLAFSPDGKSLAAAFADLRLVAPGGRLTGRVRVWMLDAARPDR